MKLDCKAIQKRVIEARVNAGFDTITAGAKAAGVKLPSAIAHENWQTGSGRMPKLGALLKYAAAYGVSLDWLVTGARR